MEFNENQLNAAKAPVWGKPVENTTTEVPMCNSEVTELETKTVNDSANEIIPKYEEAELNKLQILTALCDEEIERVISDDSITATSYADKTNCIIDLRKVSDRLYTPQVNRVHGKDQDKTGKSLRMFGAQHILLVLTVPMANAAGLKVIHFSNDPQKDKPIREDGFVLLDGNGRINYLMTIPKEDWPAIFAVFPSKEANGLFNINNCINIINTEVCVWKTEDMVQKRILMDAASAHQGWGEINELIRMGYKYQAACQLVTLGTDRIKKATVISGEADDIFIYYNSARTLRQKLQEKFGIDADTLKTKEFTKEVSTLWKRLLNKKGEEFATKTFVSFLDQLTDKKIKEISEAKNKKYNSKHEQRKKILNDEFKIFMDAQ
ncbi:MAG: hypothetical protein MJ236_06410 [Clostridia bacterium]|nr:hypothetical protein [Clostridia bacterium]